MEPTQRGPGLRNNTGLPELQRSRSYCVAAVSDIWLGCLAPRKSGAGKWPPRDHAVRAVRSAIKSSGTTAAQIRPYERATNRATLFTGSSRIPGSSN